MNTPCEKCNTLVNFINVNTRISAFPEQFQRLRSISHEIPQLKKCGGCNSYFWLSHRTSNESESELQELLFENHTRLKNYETFALLNEILEEKRQKVTHHIKDPSTEPHYQPDYEALKMVVKTETSEMLETADQQINGLTADFKSMFDEYNEHLELLNRIFPGQEENNIMMASKEQKKSLARAGLIIDYLLRCLEILKTSTDTSETLQRFTQILNQAIQRFDSKNQHRARKLLEAIDNYER